MKKSKSRNKKIAHQKRVARKKHRNSNGRKGKRKPVAPTVENSEQKSNAIPEAVHQTADLLLK